MKTNKMKLTAFLVLVLFVSIGCDDNPTNPDPESATISGTVTFTDGTFPTTAGSYVLISLQSQWPPMGAPYDYSIISESDLDQEYKCNYTFDNVAFGTYEAIAVSWANPDRTYNYTCNQSTIGAYGGSSANYFMTTDPIITSTTNFELTEINAASGNEFIDVIYNVLPMEYKLDKIYPNPFNPVTNIHYSLPVGSEVSIIVYDLQGREVISLFEDMQDPGEHSIIWNAGKESSGIYFIRMRSGHYTEMKKVIILK